MPRSFTTPTGDISIELGTLVIDYYSNNVQTSHPIGTPDIVFYGTVDYVVAHSNCAVLSMAPWVDMNPALAGTEEVDEEELPLEVFYEESEDDEAIE